jgi:hypothetical protein
MPEYTWQLLGVKKGSGRWSSSLENGWGRIAFVLFCRDFYCTILSVRSVSHTPLLCINGPWISNLLYFSMLIAKRNTWIFTGEWRRGKIDFLYKYSNKNYIYEQLKCIKFGMYLLPRRTPEHLIFLQSMRLTNFKRSEFLFSFQVCYLMTMLFKFT